MTGARLYGSERINRDKIEIYVQFFIILNYVLQHRSKSQTCFNDKHRNIKLLFFNFILQNAYYLLYFIDTSRFHRPCIKSNTFSYAIIQYPSNILWNKIFQGIKEVVNVGTITVCVFWIVKLHNQTFLWNVTFYDFPNIL